jgi:UDP-N-acetylglucosamine 2-epimerase (non-hydrolysing)
MHFNPNVREPVLRILGGHERIHLIEPLDYATFVFLMDRSYLVLTDSGGVQEEAPTLGKPVLVMRETTERPEGVQAGNAKIVGVQRSGIVESLTELLIDGATYESMAKSRSPYGDGNASRRIVEIISRL